MDTETIKFPMTLNERFRHLNLKSLLLEDNQPKLSIDTFVDEDNFDDENDNFDDHVEILLKPELTLDTLLPPRPLVDEDNFDDDHVEMFDKQLLEDELDKIHEEIGLYQSIKSGFY